MIVDNYGRAESDEDLGVVEDEKLEEIGDKQNTVIRTHINEDGTTSNYFDKRKLKIAPRSTLQFKIGPPFEFVGNYHSVTDVCTGRRLKFQIVPRIDRGFDFIEEQWVGYKRNYFTLVSSFETPNCSLNDYLKSTFQLNINDGEITRNLGIKYFAISIQARNDDDYSEISLIQHTAKRDKGPQFAPPMCPLIPSSLPKHQIIREASNVRNIAKMRKYDSTFFFHRNEEDLSRYSKMSLLNSYPNDSIKRVARYERVQFASSINKKKPIQQSRRYRLYVVLGAVVDNSDDFSEELGEDNMESSAMCSKSFISNGTKQRFIALQVMRTPALVIRGRSASNYTSAQKVPVKNSSSDIEGNDWIEKSPNLQFEHTPEASQEAITLSSPAKEKPFRPSKRKINMVKPTKKLRNSNFKKEKVFVTKNWKVETLEQIERQMKAPSHSGSLDFGGKPESNKNKLLRPVLTPRNNSIDPREIDLKLCLNKKNHCLSDDFRGFSDEENHFTIGSLALTATLKSQNLDHLKKRKINQPNYNIAKQLTNDVSFSQISSEIKSQSELEALTSPPSSSSEESQFKHIVHHQKEVDKSYESSSTELDSLSLSLLGDLSGNYNYTSNIENLHAEIDTIPRMFTRSVGETSFTNLYFQMEKSTQRRESLCHADGHQRSIVDTLPSHMMNMDDFYEEFGFYK